MITLYHGSNMEIDTIDLNRCRPNKDFGQGFYLTDIRKQAEFMALRRTRIMGEGMPMVTAYTFDEASLYDGSLKVKVFDAPCLWLRLCSWFSIPNFMKKEKPYE